jgi:hypothetical protein
MLGLKMPMNEYEVECFNELVARQTYLESYIMMMDDRIYQATKRPRFSILKWLRFKREPAMRLMNHGPDPDAPFVDIETMTHEYNAGRLIGPGRALAKKDQPLKKTEPWTIVDVNDLEDVE